MTGKTDRIESALRGQRVLVVGGTAGIGKAIAEDAIAVGAEVTVVGRSSDRAAAVADEIGAREGVGADVTDIVQAQTLFEKVGTIEHLVVAAAQLRNGPFKCDEKAARAGFEGKFWLQHRCARLADVRRSVLLFSGTFSQRPMTGMSALAAACGAIEALGRALAVELAPVRVNVISPGLIQGTDAFADVPDATRRAMVAAAAARLPVGLVGDARGLSGVALAILQSPYITGSVVNIDGGALLI